MAEEQGTPATKLGNSDIQFTLRTLLIAVTVACIWFAAVSIPFADDLGKAFYGIVGCILLAAVLNATSACRSRRLADRDSTWPTAVIIIGFAIVWICYFYVQSELLDGDLRSLLGLVGAGLYAVAGLAVLRRTKPLVVIVLLALATALLMQGVPLRLYIDGSARYDYGATPWGDWIMQAMMFLASALAIIGHRRRAAPRSDGMAIS